MNIYREKNSFKKYRSGTCQGIIATVVTTESRYFSAPQANGAIATTHSPA
jgi:hypothetical protein